MTIAHARIGRSHGHRARHFGAVTLAALALTGLAACAADEAVPPSALATEAEPGIELDVEPPEDIVEPLPQQPSVDPLEQVAPPLFPKPVLPLPY